MIIVASIGARGRNVTFPHILFVNTMVENWGIKRSRPGFPGQQDYLNIGPLKIQSLINGKVKSYYTV